MIVDERLVTYINSLETGNTAILDRIEKEAAETRVPIIRKEMQTFLKLTKSGFRLPGRISGGPDLKIGLRCLSGTPRTC